MVTKDTNRRIIERNEAWPSYPDGTLASAFPFLTKNQVKHSLRVLEGAGEITSAQPYRSKMDATKHYGFGSAE